MADIIRKVVSSAVLAVNRTSCKSICLLYNNSVRTVFTSAGIGVDNFKHSRETHVAYYAPSIEGFKKRFMESIQNPEAKIFTEDLRNMVLAASTDDEIDAVIQALRKYNSSKQSFSDYSFGSPVMRLLYIHNKTDKAIQLYMDKNLDEIFKDSASALVLMNKLVEEKRFEDCIRVFEHGIKRGFTTQSGKTFPRDVVMLAVEALYRQNTKDSLVKVKDLLNKISGRDADLNARTISMIALLAIQQGEPDFAMEIISSMKQQFVSTNQNVRAICLADLGRVEEAINLVQVIASKPAAMAGPDDRRRIFPLTMRHIRLAAEKAKNPDLMSKFEDLSKFILSNQRLSQVDFPEYINEPMQRRFAFNRLQMFPQQSQQRQQFGQGSYNFGRGYQQRQEHFGSGYGQQRGFDRQTQWNNNQRTGFEQQNQQRGFGFNRGYEPRQEFGSGGSGFQRQQEYKMTSGSEGYKRDIRDNYNRGPPQRQYFEREQRFDDDNRERRMGTGMSQRLNSTFQTGRSGFRQPSQTDTSEQDQTQRNPLNQSFSKGIGQTSMSTPPGFRPSTTSPIPTAQKTGVSASNRRPILDNETDVDHNDSDKFDSESAVEQRATKKSQATNVTAEELRIMSIIHEPNIRTKTATFSLGCFWSPDARFGAIPGVVRVRVGYTGGPTPDPTYHHLGDHIESVQIDYNSEIIDYKTLLDLFWQWHDATSFHQRQYMSAIFYHDEEQKRLAEQTRNERQKLFKRPIVTEIIPYDKFYLAEDYHQKYHLRSKHPSFFQSLHLTDEQEITSHVPTKLNGYLSGYGYKYRMIYVVSNTSTNPNVTNVFGNA
ncbi:unnamed protein product, partial [Didymodactylos carnosus]